MSGTFSGIGTLQFTPDNKRAQYFQSNSFNNVETEIGQFTTNSEYLICKIQVGVDNYDGADVDTRITLDDATVLLNRSAVTGIDILQFGYPLHIIVPPFTTLKLTMQNKSNSSSFDAYMLMNAKARLTNRVGNE